MITTEELVVDETKIRKAVQSGIPLTITTFTLPHEIEVYMEKVLGFFLREVNQAKLKDYLVYCIQELGVNAKKANTKRIYFVERGLDIYNPVDYKDGMSTFKEDTLSRINHYLQTQKDKGLYVRFVFQVKKNIINIEVRNNVVITKAELVRIHDKLARSRQYRSMEDALSQVLDDSEGAGLGLVILVLMLKKMGLDEDSFEIVGTETETIARILVPLEKASLENLSSLSKTIVDSVNSLPHFPENIVAVQRMIGDAKSEMADIARHISMDPSLTADLLKIVNSAQYMLSKKVDSIAEAVKMVGMRGLKNLLYSYGTQKILGEDSNEKRLLWDHCYKTAFFAFNLVKNFSKDKNLLDDAYVGGILHDMGKIIFANVHPALLDKIRTFCTDKGMPATTLEDLSTGMNHAEIGSMIAEKWNFPEPLVCAIQHHHDPLSAAPENRELVFAVYLANMLCQYEEGDINYDQFEPQVLDSFGITSRKQIDSLVERFSSGFKKESMG